MSNTLGYAQSKLSHAKQVCFFTGAGVSAESGVPTFRDKLTGLWANNKPEALASSEGFQVNPSHVWQWYQNRRKQLRNILPNPAHMAIAALQQQSDKIVTIVSRPR